MKNECSSSSPSQPTERSSSPSTNTMSLLNRWSGVRIPSRPRCHQPSGFAGNSVFHEVRQMPPRSGCHSVATRVPLSTGRSSACGCIVMPWLSVSPPVRYVPPRKTIASPVTTFSMAASSVVGSASVPGASARPSGAT
jgi:hypothetical protein